LLKAAIRAHDPVLFLEHKGLYRQVYAKGPEGDADFVVPIGKAKTVREGTDLTIVTWGALVHKSLLTAHMMESKGVSIEVIDLRSIVPLDIEHIFESVRKTGRVVIAHEDVLFGGFGGEIAAQIAEQCFAHLDAPVKRVEIPFENGKTIPGILQTVPGNDKAPCVLVVPGMDTIKEYMPSPYHNHFRRRGIATLTIDGPGQGESNIRETWVTLDNFERAGSAAIDFLEKTPGIDANRIGAYGWSMGSYWAPRIAAHDPRIKAVVGAMGVYEQKDTIFKHGKPAYRANYMYMSNEFDEDKFDAMIGQMLLSPLADKIKCPTLLAMGEFDELCPLEDGEALYDMLKCPKELWVFENETHTFGGRLPDFYLFVADWMKEALDGRFNAGHAKRIDFAAR
jgi:dienelactone hydrolase